MLVHTVIFWLKKELSESDRSQFFQGVKTLSNISTVEHTFLGTPAQTPKRPVVDDSYDCALTVVMKNLEDHDSYQDDQIHLDFIKNCAHSWENVQIFDAD